MIFQDNLTIKQKLTILSDAAKYDVACTSSGVDKSNNGQGIGDATNCGICHAFGADGRCISLLKVLFTNECVYDCKYCINRASNDVPRASFTPEELCNLTIEFYRRNYIEGLFLSSGIIRNPDYTMSLIYEAIYLLRTKYSFNGYIHVKGIPGASAQIVEQIGYLVDRMSINLELPTSQGLQAIAPNKTRKTILTPMRQIQQGIIKSKQEFGLNPMRNYKGAKGLDATKLYTHIRDNTLDNTLLGNSVGMGENPLLVDASSEHTSYLPFDPMKADINAMKKYNPNMRFVPAGQSTQMIVGATPENDYQIVNVAEALYKNYSLKRVFYSAFVPINDDSALPALPGGPPLLREHRLYQADFLLRFYGFEAKELLTEERPNFNVLLDPKCDWAVRHLEKFPVEVNKADYYTLLRVPGIGTKSARRIVSARRYAKLGYDDLKKMGVVLKRAIYFITCMGKMMYDTRIEENYITNHLIYNDKPIKLGISPNEMFSQLSLFDDNGILGKYDNSITIEDSRTVLHGQM